MPGRNNMERIEAALLEAKEGEIKFDPPTMKMWGTLNEQERYDILQMPRADRSGAIRDRFMLNKRAMEAMPQLSGLVGGDTGGSGGKTEGEKIRERDNVDDFQRSVDLEARMRRTRDSLRPIMRENRDAGMGSGSPSRGLPPLTDEEIRAAIKREMEMSEEAGDPAPGSYDKWSGDVFRPYGE